MLTVRGERNLEKDIKEDNFRRKERHYGAFSRSYAHGVLSIDMPKRAEAKAKQIKVNVPKTLKAA